MPDLFADLLVGFRTTLDRRRDSALRAKPKGSPINKHR